MHYSAEVAVMMVAVNFLLFAFCVYYVWRFDRFASLAIWRAESLQAVFRRLMILVYFLGPPMFAVSGVAMAVIKYRVGFLPQQLTGNPVPYWMWNDADRTWVNPVAYMYSAAWIAEVIVHSEETCFWWYMLHLKKSSSGWFVSGEVKAFLCMAVACTVGLVVPAVVKRDDPLISEAITSTVGSTVILVQNFVLTWVVFVFPDLLSEVRSTGSNKAVLSRLTYFHELNKVRVVLRFFFAVPLLILGVDGLTPGAHLNHRLWAVDVGSIIALLAFMIQAALTFLIFLPFVDRRKQPSQREPAVGARSSFWSGEPDEAFPDGPLTPSAPPAYPPGHVMTSDRTYFDLCTDAMMEKTRVERQAISMNAGPPSPTPSGTARIGSVRARRPSLVLRPRLHPSLSGFRSPIDVVQ